MVISIQIVRQLFGDEADILADTQFQLLLLSSLVVVLGTTLVSPLLDTLTDVFAVSPAVIGWFVTALIAPAIVLIPVGGALADRYGRRPILISGLVTFGGAGTAIALTTDFHVALGLRVLQGVGFSFTLPVIITCIRDLYSGPQEAAGQGFRLAVGGLSNIVFPVVAGVLVIAAWQLPFLLYSLAIPIAGAIFLWFDEPTASGEPEVESDGGANEALFDARRTIQYVTGVARLAIQRHIAAILGARLLFEVIIVGFLTYNSLIVIQVLGGTPGHAAILVAIWALVYTITATQAGRVTDRLGYTQPLLAAFGLLGAGLLSVALAPFLIIVGLGVAGIGLGIGITGALCRSLITAFAPQEFRGGLVGAGEALGRLGSSVTPILMGWTIGLLEPQLGTVVAMQATTAGTAVLASVAGIVCILVFYTARP